MQLLKSQQAKLEIRAMPAHSQLKLKEYDKKMKKKRKKKITKTSSSSLSKLSLASSGSGAAIPRSSSHKSDVQHPVPKDEQENVLKWKRRTEYIYEAERISIKLKEIATECEKDITLRLAMDDIATRMDVRIF
ncbi:hypothetical protein DINM_005901 [Dirofilaria immitis]|nr:hypothetical protein [Dirofilaria immitis]